MSFLIFILLQSAVVVSENNPLDIYRWKQRVIVIQTGEDVDMAARQYSDFTDELPELQERDVVLLTIRGEEVDLFGERSSISASQVVRACGLKPDAFGLALVGKDGGVKFRGSELVEPREIFALIDQMPMRRAEMRSGGN